MTRSRHKNLRARDCQPMICEEGRVSVRRERGSFSMGDEIMDETFASRRLYNMFLESAPRVFLSRYDV